jgi:hypothetical protein
VYLRTFGSKAPQFVAVAEKRFQREKNARVRNVVSRKIPALQADTTRPARNLLSESETNDTRIINPRRFYAPAIKEPFPLLRYDFASFIGT